MVVPKTELLNDDDESVSTPAKVARTAPKQCPYLDTINRAVLDFDFEKLCSVSLSHLNVYVCLVCGKYFQGRGQNTAAYTHSVQETHHVFLNLESQKFYCLPDNYEVVDASLSDIVYVLNPTFTDAMIAQLDSTTKLSRAYNSVNYLPGMVGLNNIKANDYCNVVLQAMSHVPPLRNFFLQMQNYRDVKRPAGDRLQLLTQRFGELARKLWNPRNFKPHVSPHEMLQAVVLCSNKRFQFIEQGDPMDFLAWLLNSLHLALNGTKKRNSSILTRTFQGKMRIYQKKIPPSDLPPDQLAQLLAEPEYAEQVTESPFMFLTCDLPPMPLYPDAVEERIIPQVLLFNMLAKFDGCTHQEYKTYKENWMKKFQIMRLPDYLILVVKRFTKNLFTVEKNHTVVNFPIKTLDFGQLLHEDSPQRRQGLSMTYDLIANIVHDGEPKSGTYRVFILHKGSDKWYEMQDLHVREILPQLITLSETYIQIYERKPTKPDASAETAEPAGPASASAPGAPPAATR